MNLQLTDGLEMEFTAC